MRAIVLGLDPPDFNPLLQMASGVYPTFFGSFVFGTPGGPFRTSSSTICRGRCGRPSRRQTHQDFSFQGVPRGPSRHGGQRGNGNAKIGSNRNRLELRNR